MRVKDLKTGSLYVLEHKNKSIKTVQINHFDVHDSPSESELRKIRFPRGINYLHMTNDFTWRSTAANYPIMYLGTTREKWWCSRADWFPIKKRHWCMYRSQRMILDAWSVKHLKSLGVENE